MIENKKCIVVKIKMDKHHELIDLQSDVDDIRYLVDLVDCSRQQLAVEIGQRIIDRKIRSMTLCH